MTNLGSYLTTNQYLRSGDYLVSANGEFFAIMQSDGNFVLYRGSGPSDSQNAIWNTHTGEGAIMPYQVVYGQTYAIENRFQGFGGYLDTRNSGCQGNLLCVSTASSRDRANQSGTWRILSATGKPAGDPVLVGDQVHLLNLYPYYQGTGGYLDTRNSGCQGNLLCVSTAQSSDRANQSGTWRILSATGKPAGSSVMTKDDVYLLNLYPYYQGTGGYLDTRNSGCQENWLCVSTAQSSDRANQSGTWRFFEQEIME